jgi:hypothetical protein
MEGFLDLHFLLPKLMKSRKNQTKSPVKNRMLKASRDAGVISTAKKNVFFLINHEARAPQVCRTNEFRPEEVVHSRNKHRG